MRLMMRVVPASRPFAVLALTELRQDRLADRLAGEAVGDESFEAVADLDPDLAVLDGDDDQESVVLAALADAPALFSNILTAYSLMSAYG